MPYYSRKRKRTSLVPRYGRKRRTGFRRYTKKAFGRRRITARPARFGFSRRANRVNNMVARTIRGMAETKVIPWRQQDYVQPVATPTGVGINCVKFIAGQTALGQYGQYTPVGGFNAPQGDTRNDRDGQFIWLKGSTVNLTVQLDNEVPANFRNDPVTFRVLCFKIKRALSPAGTTISPDTQLFLTNDGSNFGDALPSPNNMNAMDMLLQIPNTNNFRIISDRRFTLQHTQQSAAATATNNQTMITNLKNQKILRYNLKHQTKARFSPGGTEPVDFDYRYAWAIYATYPMQFPVAQGDAPTTWSASCRGTTTFNDV